MADNFHKHLVKVLDNCRPTKDEKKQLGAVREQIISDLYPIRKYEPRIYKAGSDAKGTMVSSSYDLDMVIYFPHTVKKSPKALFNMVEDILNKAGYEVERLGVSLRISLDNISVDVVPGKAIDDSFLFAKLYHNIKARLWRSSVKIHVNSARSLNQIITLMKLWIKQKELKWHKLALEQSIIKALRKKEFTNYGACIERVLLFTMGCIANGIKFFDPANCNNEIYLPDNERRKIKKAAKASFRALKKGKWNYVIALPAQSSSFLSS